MRPAQADRFGDFFADLLNLNTNASARDAARTAQLIRHANGFVDRDGKRNSLEAARAGVNLAVNADHLTAHIDQRATRVAGVDGHVGLDERQVVAGVALLGANDACRDGVLQAKRRADGHDPLAHAHAVGVTDFDGRQATGFNFHNSHV